MRGFAAICGWVLVISAFNPIQAQDTLIKAPFVTLDDLQRQQDAQISPHARVYRIAYETGDWQTAASAAHYLLLEQPDNTFLEDSIATYYFRAGNHMACKNWAEQCLRKRPGSAQLHLLLAQVYEHEGNLQGALSHYQPLAEATQHAYFNYQIAALQLRLKRMGECRATVEKLTQPNSNGERILIASANGSDEVPVEAAAWNLMGVLERELNNEKAAKAAFRKALELAPDFRLAKENLRYREPTPVHEHGGN